MIISRLNHAKSHHIRRKTGSIFWLSLFTAQFFLHAVVVLASQKNELEWLSSSFVCIEKRAREKKQPLKRFLSIDVMKCTAVRKHLFGDVLIIIIGIGVFILVMFSSSFFHSRSLSMDLLIKKISCRKKHRQHDKKWRLFCVWVLRRISRVQIQGSRREKHKFTFSQTFGIFTAQRLAPWTASLRAKKEISIEDVSRRTVKIGRLCEFTSFQRYLRMPNAFLDVHTK